jgi:hypothetical protein
MPAARGRQQCRRRAVDGIAALLYFARRDIRTLRRQRGRRMPAATQRPAAAGMRRPSKSAPVALVARCSYVF